MVLLANKHLIMATCCLFILVSNAISAVKEFPPAYFHINQWEVKNVVGKTIIKDIGLDYNGELIVATNVGLKTFNGESFKSVYGENAKFKNNLIINLEVATDGGLWGLNQLGLLKYSEDQIFIDNHIINFNINNSLAISPFGDPWFISGFKVLKRSQGKVEQVNPDIKATAIAKGADGKSMLIGIQGGFVRVDLNGNIIKQRGFKNLDFQVRSLFESSNGTIFIFAKEGLFKLVQDSDVLSLIYRNHFVVKFFEDSTGVIWFGTNKGMFIYENNELKEVQIKDNQRLEIRGIVEDNYGNIWFGTWKHGLYRLKTSIFKESFYDINPRAFLKINSDINWIGGYGGLIIENSNGSNKVTIDNLQLDIVYDLERGVGDDVWVAYYNALVRFDKNAESHEFIKDIDAFIYRVLLKDSNNRLWVGTDIGLFVKDLQSNSDFRKIELNQKVNINNIIEIENNKMLILTSNGSFIYDQGDISRNKLTEIFVDNTRVATYNKKTESIWYYNPLKNTIINFNNGNLLEYLFDELLNDLNFYSVVVSDNNDLVFLGENGVVRIKNEWIENYDLNRKNSIKQIISYEMLALPRELQAAECNAGHRSITKNLDGQINLTCKNSIYSLSNEIIDDVIIYENPIVTIKNIYIDDQKLFGEDLKSVFPPGSSKYKFTFYSESMNELLPLKYKYKLYGVDNKWVEDVSHKSITYVDLKPGSYTFEAQVKNTYSRWQSSEVGQFKFTVLPYYYQKPKFIVLFAVSVIVLSIMLFYFVEYYRNNNRIKQTIKLRKLVEEKTKSLNESRLREQKQEKISQDFLTREIERTTKELTQQMQLTLEKEKQLQEIQKMEVVGQLTSGIAHDFNNMLSIIFIGSNIIKKDLISQSQDQSKNIKWLESVLLSAENCKEVIGQLQQFTRKSKDSLATINVNNSIGDLISLLKIGVSETLGFEMLLNSEKELIYSDSGQFNQVILNLVINARDACQDYGKIVIKTSKIEAIHELICTSCQQKFKGEYIEISISDNGKGIDEDELSKIFTPFYSTNPKKDHSGIGLHVVHFNIHQMGGHVIVDSVLEQGTNFKVMLPIAKAKTEIISTERVLSNKVKVINNLSVLLVEDSASLVDLINYILKKENITVDVGIDGKEGLSLFNDNPEKYDIVLTDNSMPRMTGLDMSEKILRDYPDTKVILLSGNVNDEVICKAGEIGIQEIIHKPIEADELIEIIAKYSSI